jgi:hypothetical protein
VKELPNATVDFSSFVRFPALAYDLSSRYMGDRIEGLEQLYLRTSTVWLASCCCADSRQRTVPW